MRSNTISCCCWVITFLSLSVIFIPNSYAITLDEVVRLAIKNDARLKADQYNAEAKRADGWKSVAEYGPDLDISGSYSRSRNSSRPDSSAEIENQTVYINEPEFSLKLEQPLIDMEKVTRIFRGAAEMTIADFQNKAAIEDLMLRVNERYFNVLSSRERLNLARAESDALKSQLEAAEEKLELGFGTITDTYNADARYRLSLASEISAKTKWSNDIKALEEIINQHVGEALEDKYQQRDLPKLPETLDYWLEVARRSNTDLNLKKLQLKIASLDYRAAQSSFLPSLNVFADYKQRYPDNSLLGYGEDRSEMDFGIRITMSLMAGGRDFADTVAASKRRNASRQEVTASLRALERSVASLWESIVGTRQLIRSYYLASEANRRAMESTRSSYDEGVKVLLDVLNAQQDYYKSLREYRITRYDYLLLIEKFKLVVGFGNSVEGYKNI